MSDLSNVSSQPVVKGLYNEPAYQPTSKRLEQPGTGAASGNAELVGWYEQAYAYYNAVVGGKEPKPDQASWNEFLNQMNWAAEQLYGPQGGSGWGNSIPGAGQQPNGPQTNQFGGMTGTMDNWVYTDEK